MDFKNGLKNPELQRFFDKNFNAVTPVEAVQATETFGATTSVVTLTAVKYGTVGNNFTMAIESASEDGALALAFNPQTQTLVVTPARAAASDTTTGAELETAINADGTISSFVTASAGGVGIMAEAVAAPLTGGVDGNVNAIVAERIVGSSTSVVTLTATKKGVVGNSFSINITSSSAVTASLSLSFDKNTQTLLVTPARATDADTTTGAELEAAINADAIIALYVTASDGGAGIMAETPSAVSLNGGVSGAEGIGGFSQMLAANGLTAYFCNANATVNDSGKWSKVTTTLAS